MRFEIVYTDGFERGVKRLTKEYRSLKGDLESLVASLEKNPAQGDPLGTNCYKIHGSISSRGKGKSAGARVITYVYALKKLVCLLAIYDMSEQAKLSAKELTSILEAIEKCEADKERHCYAACLDALIQCVLIDEDKATAFQNAYKNPDEFCCPLVVDSDSLTSYTFPIQKRSNRRTSA